MKKFIFAGLIMAMLLVACTGCAGSSDGPEFALWGMWASQSTGISMFGRVDHLTFYPDGRLVLGGDETNPGEYVVIAPGRMKITQDDAEWVVQYAVVDGQLELTLEGETQAFNQVAGPEAVALSAADRGDPAAENESPPGVQGEESALPAATTTHTLVQPTATAVASATLFPTATLTATSPPPTLTPTVGLESLYVDYTVNPQDGMALVYVPEGEFIMGSSPEEDPYFWGAEGPAHQVYVDAFWIYQTEVTNAMYQACVAEQACPKPLRNESRRVADYYTAEKFADYPVIQVNWTHATAYCVWAGGRLPTEAEWEKAARGTDGRLFPWGNADLAPELASFCGSNCPGEIRESFDDGYVEIAPVGTFPAGASPYGALDMAGNVWEWTFDYFSSQYYENCPYENPRGPVSGTRRVIRGGGWNNGEEGLRTVGRASLPPKDGLDTVGFRCVVDAE